jgi:hypothetical protein
VIRYYTAAEVAHIWRRPVGTVHRLASELEWRRNEDRRRPKIYNGDDVEATMEIDDERFLAAVDEVIRIITERDGGLEPLGATRWDIAAVLTGHPEDVGGNPVDYPDVSQGLVLAKAKQLVRKGRLCGCTDGCRGDFERVLSDAPNEAA